IVADAKKALEALLKRNISMPAHEEWHKTIQGNSEKYPLWYEQSDEAISPQWLLKRLTEYTNGEAVVTTDGGQHQMWATQSYEMEKPCNWGTSGGPGHMGRGFPAAMGARLGRLDELVMSIT